MTKLFCDRCGKEMPSIFDNMSTLYPNIKLSIQYDSISFKNFDLCGECSKQLTAFVEPFERPIEEKIIIGV